MRRIACLLAILLSPPLADAQNSLRIVTLNAEWLVYTEDETDKDPWGVEYSLNEHFERIAGIIETLEPDIINLCEATSEDSIQYLIGILHEKGLTDYAGYHIESNDSSTGQDIAIITKHEPEEVDGKRIMKFYSSNMTGKWRERYSWTTGSGHKKYGSTSITKNAVCYFKIHGKKLGLLGLHLKAFPSHPKSNAQREAQAKVAQKIIKEEIVAKGYLPIVLGDLNDYDPDVEDRDDSSDTKTEVLRLIKNYDASSTGYELRNAAFKIARKFDRYTAHWDKNKDGTPDHNEPMTMIDHILLHEDLVPLIKRVFIDHGHGSKTADHWPVIVDLEF